MVIGDHGKCGVSALQHVERENESACACVITQHPNMEVKDAQALPERLCPVVFLTVQV
jgi:hypothetical protein